ncbi:MAG: DUF4494 family protein [Oscillospiraceae bacterium]|nr:DUF4494 family protein [Oscillospiraceae bacterium]
MYFEVKARVRRICDTGAPKVVSETYLTQAESFSEAENVLMKELSEQAVEFFICAVGVKNYETLVSVKEDDAEKFFKVKGAVITFNGNTGKKMTHNIVVIVRATDINLAKAYFAQYVSEDMRSIQLVGIEETKILDYIKNIREPEQ